MASYKCLCGSEMIVKDSRPSTFAGFKTIRRRRLCINADCKRRITTFELEHGAAASTWKATKALIAIANQLREAHKAIGEALNDTPRVDRDFTDHTTDGLDLHS